MRDLFCQNLPGSKSLLRLPNMEEGAPIPSRSIGIPVFQFYADLPPQINTHEILQVTDSRGVLSHDPGSGSSGEKWFWRTDKRFEDLGSRDLVLSLTDSGYAILANPLEPLRRRAFNLKQKRPVTLSHSPIFEATVSSVNEGGRVAGHVTSKRDPQKTYGRVWDQNGLELVTLTSAASRITLLEPYETNWSAGYLGESATLWSKSDPILLSVGDGARANLSNLTGSGMVGGSVDLGSATRATVWNSDGTVSFQDLPSDQSSRILALLEDSSFVVERDGPSGLKSYLVGRGDQVVPFESSSLRSIEGFPLVSVDGVSPSGIMVLTIMEPISKQITRVLVGPEAFRADSRG